MILLNFAHPVTAEQMTTIEALMGRKAESVMDVPAQFDNDQPFEPQVRELLAGIPLTPAEWQTEAFLVNLPSFNIIAVLVLTELHGRMGYFPSVLRMRPVPGSTPTRFEVAEVINLHAIRNQARKERK